MGKAADALLIVKEQGETLGKKRLCLRWTQFFDQQETDLSYCVHGLGF
jgi:hypothetical protein